MFPFPCIKWVQIELTSALLIRKYSRDNSRPVQSWTCFTLIQSRASQQADSTLPATTRVHSSASVSRRKTKFSACTVRYHGKVSNLSHWNFHSDKKRKIMKLSTSHLSCSRSMRKTSWLCSIRTRLIAVSIKTISFTIRIFLGSVLAKIIASPPSKLQSSLINPRWGSRLGHIPARRRQKELTWFFQAQRDGGFPG